MDFSPFNSASKNSKAIVQTPEGKFVLFLTGAPERVLEQ
jgi:magnesium-transporting ATPase (P-type)